MNGIVKSMVTAVAGAVLLFALVVAAIFFMKGGVWLADKLLPWLFKLMIIAVAVDVLLLPLLLFKSTKGIIAAGFVASSYVHGLTVWSWGLVLTNALWGSLAVIVGLFMVGIGVVPIAFIAAAIKSQWVIAGKIFLLVLLTLGSRKLGFYIAEREGIAL